MCVWTANCLYTGDLNQRAWYWVGFIVCQALGAILPLFGNVHMNVFPMLLGLVLLLPGILVVAPFKELPEIALLAIAVAVNFGAWWFVSSWMNREKSDPPG